jgi:hypothetical protein
MPVTASIGVAERQIDGVDRLRSLVEFADRRMYEAKQAGRNSYCFLGRPVPWIHNIEAARLSFGERRSEGLSARRRRQGRVRSKADL